MTNLRALVIALTLIGGFWIQTGSCADPAPRKAQVLFVTQSKGFKHGSVTRAEGTEGANLSPAEIAMTQLGQQTGLFDVHCTQDVAADFTKANLQNYDIVMFYTTGDLPIAPADSDYFFKEWAKQKGHGVIGFHSATDTFHEFEPYWDMMGATFVEHPWGSRTKVTLTVHDKNHPASRPFPDDFQIRDEIYRYRHWQPEKVHVLLSLNMDKCKPQLPYHVPVSWVKDYGQGKLFYSNLGHNEATWRNKIFLASVEGGIRWILGLEAGDATPNPEVSKAEEEKVKHFPLPIKPAKSAKKAAK